MTTPLRALHRAAALFVVILALAAHARSLGGGFVYDDPLAIAGNPVVTGPFAPTAFFTHDYWGGHAVGTWRPLPLFTLWLDWRSGSGSAWTFHFTNLLAHAAAALALFYAVRRATPALIFAVLAVGTEAVAGVVGRADVLAAGFCFLAWGLDRRSSPWSAVAFFAALLCKESALALPFWLLAVAGPGRRHLWLVAAIAVYAGLRIALFELDSVAVAYNNNPLVGADIATRIWTGLELTTRALRLIVAPVALAPDYGFAEILPATGPSLDGVIGGLALLGLVAAGIGLRRRAPLAAQGALLLLVSWAAIANVAALLPTLFAERLLYLPGAGAALLATAALDWLERRTRVGAAGLLVLVIGANGLRGVVRDADWVDDLSLFSSAVESTPRSTRSLTNHGAALVRAGRHEEALASLARALELAPLWAQPHALAGIALDQLGEPARAEAQLALAVRLDADSEEAAFDFGLFLARHGRHDEARTILRPFVLRHPEATRPRALLNDLERR